MRIALIDADILVYYAGFAAQRTSYRVELKDGTVLDFNNAKERDAYLKEKEILKSHRKITPVIDLLPEKAAIQIVKRSIGEIMEATKADKKELWLTGDNNFRKEVAKTRPYKGNRNQEKPVYYQLVKDYLVNSENARIVDKLEADDMLGIRSQKLHVPKKVVPIICTIDKDLNMVPGFHYNWKEERKYKISEEEGMYNFCLQLLQGDSTDNIPGVPGVGEKRSTELLEGSQDPLKTVREVYKEKELSEEYLIEQATLLWIKRKRDEDIKEILGL